MYNRLSFKSLLHQMVHVGLSAYKRRKKKQSRSIMIILLNLLVARVARAKWINKKKNIKTIKFTIPILKRHYIMLLSRSPFVLFHLAVFIFARSMCFLPRLFYHWSRARARAHIHPLIILLTICQWLRMFVKPLNVWVWNKFCTAKTR